MYKKYLFIYGAFLCAAFDISGKFLLLSSLDELVSSRRNKNMHVDFYYEVRQAVENEMLADLDEKSAQM